MPRRVIDRAPTRFPEHERNPRVIGKTLFLTYPQCSVAKEELLEKTKTLPSLTQSLRSLHHIDYKHAIVCREDHEASADDNNVGIHLHAFIAFSKRTSITHETLTALTGKHGNYQGARSPKNVVKYVMKHGDFISDGFDPVEFTETKGKIRDQIARMAMEGTSFEEIEQAEPGFTLIYHRQIEAAVQRTTLRSLRDKLLPWEIIEPMPATPDNSEDNHIIRWLNEHIRAPAHPDPLHIPRDHLYIYSAPGMGKTYLVNWLRQRLSVYDMASSKFQSDYKDGCYDVIICDEFNSHIPLMMLNKWMDGATAFEKKGGQDFKRDKIPFIFLSNKHSYEQYVGDDVNSTQKEAFMSRLENVELRKKLTFLYPR